MDQQKTGELLKRLRKEKGLTQEQLAERFYVSSRTVSRWETGSNMPDVGMLIELADFYDVDIREIIDGERKSEMMDYETKDTLKKVAAYATEKEKGTKSKILYTALGICVALIVCTILFADGTPGLLCGIIPKNVCYHILAVAYGLAVFLLISYLRVLPFMEKPSYEPERIVQAAVMSKEIRSGTQGSGRSQMGYSFVITFLTETGDTMELFAYENEFGGIKEGMKGALTYKGRYFVSFQDNA